MNGREEISLRFDKEEDLKSAEILRKLSSNSAARSSSFKKEPKLSSKTPQNPERVMEEQVEIVPKQPQNAILAPSRGVDEIALRFKTKFT